MSAEAKVAVHYTRPGLEEMILRAVERSGKDPAHLSVEDLAPVDEFHVGGLEATKELAARMELRPGMQVLDVGAGIGGPARYFAAAQGCKVNGVDLTEEFVTVANSLTRRLKLGHAAEFRQGSALSLPFAPGSFDRAYMIHVGMNIADKAGVFREVRRVLKPGGLFAVFDIMRAADGPIQFPVPWALTAETSFVASAKEYRSALENANFRVEQERDRTAFGIEFTEKNMARVAQGGPPILGLQLLIGDKTPAMMKSMVMMLKQGTLAPIELYARPI